MNRVAYYIHGRGRGHATRSRVVVAALRAAGCDVVVHAGGDALPVLSGEPDPGLAGMAPLVARAWRDRQHLRRLAPDVLVTDGDAPSLVAAKTLGMPTVAVGHGLLFANAVLPSDLPRMSLAYERVNAGSSSFCADRVVAVHFLPIAARDPRRTCVARQDCGELQDSPVARASPKPKTLTDEGFVLAYFRDGNGAGVLSAALAAGTRVVCFGRLDDAPAGVDLRPPDRTAFVEHLARCTAVIGSSGCNLLSECVLLSKPVLALHRARDHEQILNGALLAAAGVGATGRIDRITLTEVAAFLDRAASGRFARVALDAALPPVSEAVCEAVAALACP